VQAQGSTRAETVLCRGRTRAQARVWLEVRDDLDKRAPACQRERGEERGGIGELAGSAEEASRLANWAA
jgi:hypothetical protein